MKNKRLFGNWKSMARWNQALLAIGFSMLFSRDASAVTYLKANAPAGGDGASWDTAFTDFVDAVHHASTDDNIVYAAGGLYLVREKVEVTDGFKMYGGFPGHSMQETLADRDVDGHPTILTGDADQDDCWVHVVPVSGEYRFEKTELPEEKILSNGAIHFPPAYTGDYDCYIPKVVGPAAPENTIIFSEEAGGVLDGLSFVAFAGAGKPCVKVSNSEKDKEVRIHNCRFIGNAVGEGAVADRYVRADKVRGKMVVTSCQFRFTWVSGRVGGIFIDTGTQVEDCLFESLNRECSADGGVIYFYYGIGAPALSRCVFTRCTGRSTRADWEDDADPPGLVAATCGVRIDGFYDCVVSNCFTASPFACGSPLFAMLECTMAHCSFVNNRYEVKPVAGRTYTIFDNVVGKDFYQCIRDCSFRGNVIAAPSVAAESGTYALGILGNAGVGNKQAIVNCTFDSNEVEFVPVEGVTPILSRALVSSAQDAAVATEMGVANCTFSGPRTDGVHDIVQWGEQHKYPLNVVNSIFMTDGVSVAHPFYIAAPAQFKVIDSTIQNLRSVPLDSPWTGLGYDPVAFVREEEATVGHVPVLVPAIRTPSIRKSADVSCSGTRSPWHFRYRRAGETEWQPLLPWVDSSVTQTEGSPLPDANGNARELGSYTRGAVQPLTETAETGASLVLRCEPFDGGSLSSPSSQAVVRGTRIQDVTATPAGKNSFDGWLDTDGNLFSASPVLSIPALDADKVLVARFGTPKQDVTFDLGQAGVFKANGLSTITLSVGSGVSFPEIPPYEPSEEWLVDGWEPTFPGTVPEKDSRYVARYVTTGLHVVRVVPTDEKPAGSDDSGDSWANAKCDLAAAIAEAGRYRGEVWVKEGVYVVGGNIDYPSNVSVFGGFTGSEASVAEADPVAHPTIITGDAGQDNYWQPNGSDPADGVRLAVWENGAFNAPNPDGSDDYWRACDPGKNDAENLFHDWNGAVTNVALNGLTFTGFRLSVISLSKPSGWIVRECRFLASGTAHAEGAIAFDAKNGNVCLENCEFTGNCCAVSHSTGLEGTSISLRNCVFRDNVSSSGGVSLRIGGNVVSRQLEGCSFIRNCALGGNGADVYLGNKTPLTIENCLFKENRTLNGGRGAIYVMSDEKCFITNCRFIGNRLSNPAASGRAACLAVPQSYYSSVIVRDTYFKGNRLESSKSPNGKLWGSVAAFDEHRGSPLFINCTMTGNVASNGCLTDDSAVGTIASLKNSCGFANCVFDRSVFSGNAAEIVFGNDSENNTLALVNTIMCNESADYVPFSLRFPAMKVSLASCAISGLDVSALEPGKNGYLLDVTSEAGAVSTTRSGPDGQLARGVSTASPYVRAGRPVWLYGKDQIYFYDDVSHPDKPIRSLTNKSNYGKTPMGISLETPLAPDAFGAPRVIGKVAYGPLNALSGGTILMLR